MRILGHIIELMDAYLVRMQKENDRDMKKFHPSAIGKCTRELVYSMLGYPEPDIAPRTLMIFQNGHYYHHRMEEMFDKAEILIAPELTIRNADLNISGRTDAVIRNPNPYRHMFPKDIIKLYGADGEVIYEGPNNEVALVELKSINNKGFNRVCNKEAKPEHIAQLQIYMFLSGIKQGVIYYENKDTQAQWEYWVEYDEALVNTLVKKIEHVNKCAKENVIPPRENSRSSFACTYCSYNGLCWGDSSKAYTSIDELI